MLAMKKTLSLSLCFFLLFTACQYREGIFATISPTGDKSIEVIAILPFHGPPTAEPRTKMASCPICGAVFQTDKLGRDEIALVEALFVTRLKEMGRYRIIPPEQTENLVSVREVYTTGNLSPIIKKINEQTGADAVVVGHVFRYRERIGYPYAVEKPASVALEVHLIRVSDEQTIWKGLIDRTQSSLMENVLLFASFYKRGGRWLTVKEFTEEGIEELLKTFP